MTLAYNVVKYFNNYTVLFSELTANVQQKLQKCKHEILIAYIFFLPGFLHNTNG